MMIGKHHIISAGIIWQTEGNSRRIGKSPARHDPGLFWLLAVRAETSPAPPSKGEWERRRTPEIPPRGRGVSGKIRNIPRTPFKGGMGTEAHSGNTPSRGQGVSGKIRNIPRLQRGAGGVSGKIRNIPRTPFKGGMGTEAHSGKLPSGQNEVWTKQSFARRISKPLLIQLPRSP